MKLIKFLVVLLTPFIVGCGGGSPSGSVPSTAQNETYTPEDINFTEESNGDLKIEWNKTDDSYRVLAIKKSQGSGKAAKEVAIEQGDDMIVVYETTDVGNITIDCMPSNLGGDIVTYECSVYKDSARIETVLFDLYASNGRYSFVMGWGNSYDTAKFEDVGEKISTVGLDIDVRFGEYQLTDNHRTFDEYHGYFLLLPDNVAKGREFFADTASGDYTFVWSYDRDRKIITLDNTGAGGGYAEGRVYGNNNEIGMGGHWSGGAVLDATLTYMSDSTEFTKNSKVLSKNKTAVSHYNAIANY